MLNRMVAGKSCMHAGRCEAAALVDHSASVGHGPWMWLGVMGCVCAVRSHSELKVGHGGTRNPSDSTCNEQAARSRTYTAEGKGTGHTVCAVSHHTLIRANRDLPCAMPSKHACGAHTRRAPTLTHPSYVTVCAHGRVLVQA